MNPPLDPYRVLQILPDADQEEIKAAFRRLARRYHPDRAPDAASMARMIEVNRAWELIGDPARRAAFDRSHGIVRGPRPVERSKHQPESEPGGHAETTSGTPARETPAASPPADAAVPPADRAERPQGDAPASASTSGTSSAPGTGWGATSVTGGGTSAAQTAGPPPGRPSGTVLTFGRYEGWSLGEIARVDREYLEWLVRMPIGWQYGDEIRALLGSGRADASAPREEPRRRFRR